MTNLEILKIYSKLFTISWKRISATLFEIEDINFLLLYFKRLIPLSCRQIKKNDK